MDAVRSLVCLCVIVGHTSVEISEAAVLIGDPHVYFYKQYGENNSSRTLYCGPQIKFSSIIRGYHVYQSAWESAVGKELYGKHDSSPDAFDYDQFAVGLYRKRRNASADVEELCGHVPVEQSSLVYHFLNADPTKRIRVEVTGKRKGEVGLVVPCDTMRT